MKIFALFILGFVFLTACASEPNQNLEQEFCGTSIYDPCTEASDCRVGGCSSQICESSSQEPIVTSCEYRDCYNAETYDLSCSCKDQKCQWT